MRAVLTVVISVAAAALAACTTVTTSPSPSPSSSSSSSVRPSAPGTSPPASTGAQAAPPAPAGVPASSMPNVTDPWAVVSAYYGDIESGDFAQAWTLVGSGATTGQTYQQFVSGFACTGSQSVTEVGESGDQVTFDLAATNSCSGQVQDFTGTDTVQNGMIVAAHVVQTG
jgi:curli biogenesis system outer membrane secretion channel CsgG